MNDVDILDALEYFKKLHAKQKYPNGKPYWPHLESVGLILKAAFTNDGRPQDEVIELAIAGFGHDSLEDTDVTVKELQERFGENVAGLIFGMTNEQDDVHTDEYIQKVCRGPEKVRLIKLADMIDNYSRIAQSPKNESEFLRENVLPIIEPMFQCMLTTKFVKYDSIGRKLLTQAAHARDRARKSISTVN